jgi:hypothetical protein
MGLKRRNPARTRLLNQPEPLTAPAPTKAPAAKVEVKPAVPVTQAAPPAAPPRPAPVKRPVGGEERHRMIQKLAYTHAERSGFRADPVQSWLHAEREVDAELALLAS